MWIDGINGTAKQQIPQRPGLYIRFNYFSKSFCEGNIFFNCFPIAFHALKDLLF